MPLGGERRRSYKVSGTGQKRGTNLAYHERLSTGKVRLPALVDTDENRSDSRLAP